MSSSNGPYRTPEPIEEESEYRLTTVWMDRKFAFCLAEDKASPTLGGPKEPGKWKIIDVQSVRFDNESIAFFYTWKRVKDR